MKLSFSLLFLESCFVTVRHDHRGGTAPRRNMSSLSPPRQEEEAVSSANRILKPK